MKKLFKVVWVWMIYFFPFLFFGYSPKIGNEAEADCIWVQAFGRNTYPDQDLGATLVALRQDAAKLRQDPFVLLQRFGFDPGQSNRALAKEAIRLVTTLHIPVQAQWEVAFAMYELAPVWYAVYRCMVDCVWPPASGYFATFHVKMACAALSRARRRNRPLELAHPAMKIRAVPIIWRISFEPIVAESKRQDSLWVWDANSVQPWTRSFRQWIVRETIGRYLHVWFTVLPWTRDLLPTSLAEKLPGKMWVRFTPPLP